MSTPNAFRRPGGHAERGSNLIIEPGGRDMPPIGAEIDKPGIRWDVMFNLFLRLMALVWLFKGVGYWAIVLGLGETPFTEEPAGRQALFIAFSLLDCSAAVGIWLLSPWGKSLWVFVMMAEIIIGLAQIGSFVQLRAVIGTVAILFSFFLLTFAARQRYLGKF